MTLPIPRSKFFDIFFRNLPFPVAAGIVRGIKTALAIIVPVIATGLIDGTILSGVHFLPAGSALTIGVILAPIIYGIEVYLRQNGLLDSTPPVDPPTTT